MPNQTPWFISADGHMSEPLDLWITRLDKKFRDRAPHVEFDNAGQPGAWWVYEGYKPTILQSHSGRSDRTDEEKHTFIKVRGYADARPGAGTRRTPEGHGGRRRRGEVLYTRWASVFSGAGPSCSANVSRVQRLVAGTAPTPQATEGDCFISLYDPRLGAGNGTLRHDGSERCHGWVTLQNQPYWLDMYDVFWAKAQELGVPVSLHPPTGMARPKSEFERNLRPLRPVIAAQEVQRSLGVIIASGVLERFPNLNVISAEYGIAWTPWWLDRINKMVGVGPSRRGGYDTKLSMKPT